MFQILLYNKFTALFILEISFVLLPVLFLRNTLSLLKLQLIFVKDLLFILSYNSLKLSRIINPNLTSSTISYSIDFSSFKICLTI